MQRVDDGMSDRNTDAGRRAVQDDEVERLRHALNEEQQRHLRLRADFDNVRRRASREQEAARRDGQRAALLPLLSVLDSLERALAAGSTDPDFYEGVTATHRLFVKALHEAGADPVESVGRSFDPKVHEGVATMPSGSVEPGIVVHEVRRGWRLGDELLRPAQVVVAAPREADGSWR
jgi:molecular chaperone GrpE